MDYVRLYDRFIQSRRAREERLDVADVHHIRPRCLGGCDNSDNLIRLSPGDHLFAHLLLARIYGSTLVTVFLRMSGMKKYRGGRDRRRYDFLQRLRREQLREWWTPARREQHSQLTLELWNRPDSPMRTSAITEAKRERLLGNALGRNASEKTREKLRAAARKRWDKPGAREEQSRRSTEQWSDPAARRRHAQQISEIWSDPVSEYNTADYRQRIGRR